MIMTEIIQLDNQRRIQSARIPYHILEVLVLVREFLLERRVQSTHDKVAVVLVLHQFLDAALLEEADAATIQHRRRHVLQELLVLTASAQTNGILNIRRTVQISTKT